MKKFILIGLLSTSIGLLFAQPGPPPGPEMFSPERMERMESLKVAYITEKLNLSTDEAAKFWPVYNEHHDKMREIRMDEEKWAKMKNLESMTDDEISKMLDNEIVKQATMLELQKDFYQKLKKVLPVRKIALLHEAERQFKRELLKMSRDRQGGPPRPPAPGR